MKKVIITLFAFCCTVFLGSCEKEDNEGRDFYTLDYRKGLWVTPDKKDTLQFVNSSSLVLKGFGSDPGEFSYKIENNILFILPGTPNQTEHPIVEVEQDRVVIDNMYISIEFLNNSATLIKQ